ncbi:hypothetical protein MAE02_65670 [Microvirga aerophila]|uniref:Uncharacterized protein n=1 Tax=Microvirga aerophila TaxID=670291 RepID=A0A512C3U0_9HYPH|nr:hypothetical protein MAE02_65670 [Microvirga aerophila]
MEQNLRQIYREIEEAGWEHTPPHCDREAMPIQHNPMSLVP